jgi:exopolysaccharide biosynthesis polyprenyl glycosylphosphotransferase
MSRLAESLIAASRNAPDREEFTRRSHVVAGRFFFASVIGDALIILGVSVFVFQMLYDSDFTTGSSLRPEDNLYNYLGYFIFGALSLMLLLAHYRAYEPTQHLRYRQDSFLIIKSCFLWGLAMVCITRLFDFHNPLPRIFTVVNTVSLTLALLFWRLLMHRIAAKERFSRYLRERILFVGWNELSERCASFIRNDPNQPYTLVGCIPSIGGTYESEPPLDLPHMAAQGDLVRMFKAQRIDIVILADRTSTMRERDELATLCEKEMVQFKVIPSYFPILVSGLSIQTISGIPVLGISHLPLDRPVNRCLKRAIDVIGANVGLILSAPIIAIFGAIVYFESPGSIFYRQRRLGRNGLTFEIIKIRSMRLNAESGTGPRWAVKDDPRRLRIGTFMRSWNIDELPQFWNVLRGEMSLVGVRPERPELIESFKEEISHYNARHSAKPGITGWAAVNGLRGDTDLRERIRCDLYYLENWSLWLDLQIMIMTFFRREGAG